jgi:hypothetical protein
MVEKCDRVRVDFFGAACGRPGGPCPKPSFMTPPSLRSLGRPQGRWVVLLAIKNMLKDEQIAALSDVVSQAELAAESGMSPAAKRKEFQRLRAKVLGVISSKGFLVAGGFAALVGRRSDGSLRRHRGRLVQRAKLG